MNRAPTGYIAIDFFHSASTTISEALALLDRSAVRPTIVELVPAYESALADLDARDAVQPRSLEAALWFYTLVKVVGAETSDAMYESTRCALARVPHTGERARSFALSALALYDDDLARSLEPTGFTAMLLECATSRAGIDQIEAEWLGYLRAFPRAVASGEVSWPDLACASCVVHNRILNLPAGYASRETRTQIAKLAVD
jgi:hypothetical protein